MERNFISYSGEEIIKFTCLQMYSFICASDGKFCLSERFVLLSFYIIKIGKINKFYCINTSIYLYIFC